MKTLEKAAILVPTLGEGESLLSLSDSIDQLVEQIASSMSKVNGEIKRHSPPNQSTPSSLLKLYHLIRGEEAHQSKLSKEIQGKVVELGVVWKALLEKGDAQSKDTAEMIGLKLAMVDYDLKCREAGMSSALAFPRRRLREMRRAKMGPLIQPAKLASLCWKLSAILACLILFPLTFFGWVGVFPGMLISGSLFLLAGVVLTVQEKQVSPQ